MINGTTQSVVGQPTENEILAAWESALMNWLLTRDATENWGAYLELLLDTAEAESESRSVAEKLRALHESSAGTLVHTAELHGSELATITKGLVDANPDRESIMRIRRYLTENSLALPMSLCSIERYRGMLELLPN